MTTPRTAISKSEPKKVTKLEELLVEEVSMVDRPANQRRFLTVKSEDAKGAEITPGPGGKLTTPAPTPAPVTKSMAESLASVGDKLIQLEKRLSITPNTRTALFNGLREAISRLDSIFLMADVAETDWDGSKGESTLMPLLSTELGEVATALGKLAKAFGKVEKSETPENEAETALKALVEGLETAVQKRGAKMSKARLTTFKSAMEALASILAELDDAVDDVEKADAHTHTFKVGNETVTTGPASAADGADHTHTITVDGKKLTTTAAPAGPSHAHSVTADGKTVKGSGPAAPPVKPAFPPQGKPPVAKAESSTRVEDPQAEDPKVTALTQQVEKLTETVKKQAADLRGLRKAPQGSNAIPVEKSSGDGPREAEVSWPLDMNDEKTTRTVAKAVSFIEG